VQSFSYKSNYFSCLSAMLQKYIYLGQKRFSMCWFRWGRAAMAEWLCCFARTTKILCLNLVANNHRMTLDKSLTAVSLRLILIHWHPHPIFNHKCFCGSVGVSVWVLYSSLTETPCFCYHRLSFDVFHIFFVNEFSRASVQIRWLHIFSFCLQSDW